MPNLSEISNGTKLILGAGVLLVIDTFFKWWKVDVGPFSVGQNAWHGFWGIVMVLALILLLAWVVIQVLNVKLNFELPITEAWLTLGLGVIVFAFALIKNIADDNSTIWSYIGVLLAAGVAIGAWLRAQELGGVTMARTTPEPPPTPPSQPDV